MISSKIMIVFQWIMNFVFLNLLFLLGTLLGGIILGFFPSFQATIVVSRQLLNEPDTPLFKFFVHEYKKNFIISQKFGFLFLFLVSVAFSNLLFWNNIQGVEISEFIKIFWFIIFVVVSLGTALIFPLVVQSKLTLRDTGRLFLFSLSQWHLYFILVMGLLVILCALLILPGIFVFLAGSLAGGWIMFSNQLFVNKILKIQARDME